LSPTQTRRQFLLSTAAATGAVLASPLRASAIQTQSSDGGLVAAQRLDAGWQFRRGPASGLWEITRAEDDDLWSPVSLPHSTNAQDACDPDHPYYRGQSWYRTTVQVRNPHASGRTLLHFQGAGQTTTLWIGTTLIGTHTGGYDEFTFDITDQITTPALKVVVLCDNSPDLDRVPSSLSDFCLYGGLYRHVNLVYLPTLALDAVHILPTLNPDGSADVEIQARLLNPTGVTTSATITAEILSPTSQSIHRFTQTLKPSTEYQPVTTLTIPNPSLWSPTTPKLYVCRVTLVHASGQSQIEQRFGIRHFEFVEHGPFKLNGQRLLLRGTHRHADHAGYAAAQPDDLVREELALIREMGANFIRLAHYQQDRLVLDLCDELGLLVWEEVPWCRAGVGSKAFQQDARDMLTHMIDQHYNHPSIILWGLGNEDDWPDEYPSINKPEIRAFYTELRDLAHSLDPSRLTSIRRCDFARDIPDVYSPSIWAGWYSGNYHDYEHSLVTQRERVKRFVHMEWGADSLAGRHAEEPDTILRKIPPGERTDEHGLAYLQSGGPVRVSRDGDWSETYACNLFDWHLKTQEKLEWLTGSAQWIFKDFPSPLRDDSSIPRMNQKGVVERDLTKKESFYVFQSFWAEKPMAHIYGHTWPIRRGKPGETRQVNVYSNCDRAELFLNGKSLGTKQRDSQDYPAAGLHWQVAFIPGANHLNVIASKGATTVTDQVDLTYQTEPWGRPSQLVLKEKSRDQNTVTVTATLHDAMGVTCLDARHTVRFSAAGDAALIDNQGTSRASREIQLANGGAQISLTRTGPCSVAVSTPGLPAAVLNFS
jgi:beta-galactosidase